MKVSIVFHSVCGNTYLIAKEIHKNFLKRGIETKLYRIEDKQAKDIAKYIPTAKEYFDEIMDLPKASLEKIIQSDYIFLGSPTYFGNVSGQMKLFMDSFSPLWSDSVLYGKKLISFTTCGQKEGGGESCLKSINTFGNHLGMVSIPIPTNIIENKGTSSYGLIHCSGENSKIRIEEHFKNLISNFVDLLIKNDMN